jgi:8-oxo-dGTP diphosphatase
VIAASMLEARDYPQRPFLAVSAVILRHDRILLVRRARPPAKDLYTLPGGVVEAGETLTGALAREVEEETAITIDPVDFIGYREVIARDDGDRVKRHFVIVVFAAWWRAGEGSPNEEISEARWTDPDALDSLRTTEGLAQIVAAGIERLRRSRASGAAR